jgi:hypothetical protein
VEQGRGVRRREVQELRREFRSIQSKSDKPANQYRAVLRKLRLSYMVAAGKGNFSPDPIAPLDS